MNKHLSKRQVVEIFQETILPSIPPNDRPAKRQAWNDFTDGLMKEGQIPEAALYGARAWDQPACVK